MNKNWSREEMESYRNSLERAIEKYPRIPEMSRDSLVQYILMGRPVGSFLHAVLSNNLMQAVWRADDHNQVALHEYAKFLCNHAPIDCYGSEKATDDWRASGGMMKFMRPVTETVQ